MLLSIDWDHTLRHFQGLDSQLLTLITYCRGKRIPVGLTTHRDRENFILYSLYYWQTQTPQDKTDALSAAIDYWQKSWFEPMGVKFDFINARYQPNYKSENYYLQELLPLEKQLAKEIKETDFLWDKEAVKERILHYTKEKEVPLPDNEFKQAQVAWLMERYTINDPLRIWHIDDCERVSNNLPVQTLHYTKFPLYSHPKSMKLVEELGLLEDARAFLASASPPAVSSYSEGLALIATLQFILDNTKVDPHQIEETLNTLECAIPSLANLVNYTKLKLKEPKNGFVALITTDTTRDH